MQVELSKDIQITNVILLEKINDLEIQSINLQEEIKEIKQDLTNQITDMKSILMDAMATLSKAFHMNCQGTLNLREEMSENAGTYGPDLVNLNIV